MIICHYKKEIAKIKESVWTQRNVTETIEKKKEQNYGIDADPI